MTTRLQVAVALALTVAAGSARADEWTLWEAPWHDAAIAAVDATADTAVSLSGDGSLRWWAVPAMAPLGRTTWERCDDVAVALSPDGRTVAALEGAQRELVLVGRDGARRRLEPGGSVSALAWVDGALVAGLADGSLRRWGPGSAEPLTTPAIAEDPIRTLAAGPRGLLVGRGGEFGAVELRDGQTLALVRTMTLDTAAQRAHPSSYFMPPSGLAWSADGKRVAAAAEDAPVWDVETGLLLARVAPRKHDEMADQQWVTAVAFEGPGGESLLAASMPLLVRWDVASGQQRGSFALPFDWNGAQPATIAMRPQDGWVLTGDISGGLSLQGLDGAERSAVRGQHASLRSVAFSPQADVVVAGHADGALTVWVAATAQRMGAPIHVHGGGVSALEFSPDGARLASAGGRRVVIWSLAGAGRPVTLSGHEGGALDLAWAPDGSRLVTTAGDGRVRLWDAVTGEPLRSWEGHPGGATAVAWGKGDRIATVGEDGVLRTWSPGSDAADQASPRQPRAYTGVAWAPDGRTLATTEAFRGDGPVRLWAADLKELRHFEAGPIGCHDLAFTPQGELAAACLDARVRVWSLPSGKLTTTLHAFDGYGMALALNAAGTRLALGTAGQEQALRVWTRR